jgi:hypothetical protein
MIFRALILALVLSLGLTACSKFSGNGATWHGDAALAHNVTAGMSQNDVKGLLGEPSGTQVMKIADQSLTTWYYLGEKDNVNIVFDTAGKVVTVGLNGAELVKPAQD